jgi:hypothetical protein
LGVILGCFPILIALMLLYYYLTARAMETAEPAAKDRKVTGIRKETAAR